MSLVAHHIRPHILKLQPYLPGKPIGEAKREIGLTDFIKLASNENPLGPSPRAIEAMGRAAHELHRYPDASGYELRRVLAESLELPIEQVMLGNGSDEIIHLLGLLFMTEEDNAVVGDPSFVRYDAAIGLADSRVKRVPLDREYSLDLDAMLAAIDLRTRLAFIANPNNPTGTIVSKTALSHFIEALPSGVLTVIDEAYFEYAQSEPEYPDAVELLRSGKSVVGLRTFSKAYGLAGIRMGYAFGPPEIIDALNRVRQPFNANHLAQVGAMEALKDSDHLARSIEQAKRSIDRISNRVEALGGTAIPSFANFVWVDLQRPAQPVYEALLVQGVIVRPIGGKTMLRISGGTDEQTERFVEAFEHAMKEKVIV